tara:strand:- start:254 stop:445 length:192 start_codon:yes stop_codon:yes gene_type:complete
MTLNEAKKLLKETRELTNGVMPLIIVLNDREEYDMMNTVKKEMRNVKNIEFEIADSPSDRGSS